MDTAHGDSSDLECEFHEDDTLPFSSRTGDGTLNGHLVDTLNTTQSTTNGMTGHCLDADPDAASRMHHPVTHPSFHDFTPSLHMENAVPTRRGRSLTVEVSTDDFSSSSPWCCWGSLYRRCCFSMLGIRFSILLNSVMILLNSGMIIYEILLIIQQHTVIHTELPLWYIICDITITAILLTEMLLSIAILHAFNVCTYLRHWECWVDAVVLILSIACCVMYYIDFRGSQDMDNLTMLLLRIIRDVVRIGRTLWFFKMLYSNLIRLELRRKKSALSRSERSSWKFHGLHGHDQSLLGNDRTVIVVNHSPKSTCSDQRDYKGPKRVDVHLYDELHRDHNHAVKQNHKKMYSQTPSPPQSRPPSRVQSAHKIKTKIKRTRRARDSEEIQNQQINQINNHQIHHQNIFNEGNPQYQSPSEFSLDSGSRGNDHESHDHIKSESQHSGRSFQRNVTRNCDELMEEFGLNRNDGMNENGVNVQNGNDPEEEYHEISGGDHTTNSSHHSQYTGSLKSSSSRHRSTSTKVLSVTDLTPEMMDIADNEHSLISNGTTASNDIYYDNLKLKKIEKKKPVDTQRLKDLLNNLPSDIGRSSGDSSPSSENDPFPLKLHDEEDKLTIV